MKAVELFRDRVISKFEEVTNTTDLAKADTKIHDDLLAMCEDMKQQRCFNRDDIEEVKEICKDMLGELFSERWSALIQAERENYTFNFKD